MASFLPRNPVESATARADFVDHENSQMGFQATDQTALGAGKDGWRRSSLGTLLALGRTTMNDEQRFFPWKQTTQV